MTAPGLSYVLPLRWTEDSGCEELTSYLRRLSRDVEVIVVDASPGSLYDAHAAAWARRFRHVRPDPDLAFRNGKVNGVTTGVRLASSDKVVIADDDVRYDLAGLQRVTRLLDRFDLVRPQNYFAPLPWHAVWDTARTLLNRSAGADYPGTLAFRKSAFDAVGGYDGDVLFENLELIRTIRASGGAEAAPLDLYVRRLPPATAHFFGQRVRQAYDDLALPRRLGLWLSIVPACAYVLRRGAFRALGIGVLTAIAAAETGRRRGGGARYFPAAASACAPGWLLERGICIWIAIVSRVLKGGVVYADTLIERAATPVKELERRFG